MYLEIIFRLMGKLQEKPRNSYKPFFQTHSCFLSYSCYSLPLYMLTYTHTEHFSFLHLLTVVCSSLYHAIFFWIYIGYPRFVSCPSNVLSGQKWVSFPPLCLFIWKNSVFKDFCKGFYKGFVFNDLTFLKRTRCLSCSSPQVWFC